MKFRFTTCLLIGWLSMSAASLCTSAVLPETCQWGPMQPPGNWGLKRPLNVCRTSDGKVISANAECIPSSITVTQLAKLFSVPAGSCDMRYENGSFNYECHTDQNETILGSLTGPSGCSNFSAGYLSYIAQHPFVSD